MTELIDNQTRDRAMKGVLALQIHVGPPMFVQFKNIRIKRQKLTAGMKKVVLIAGKVSHGIGEHEFNAGCTLLQKCLDQVPGVITAKYTQGWPTDRTAFDNADTLVFFMDGGSAHPLIQGNRLIGVHKLMQQGMGLACLHYAVEVPQNRGGPEFLDWIGGYFEAGWSVNPHWTANFTKFPVHPITRGVQPFSIEDEWYYHMRFRNNMESVTPILTDIPPASTLERPDGPHSGNPAVRAEKGKPQHVAWAVERTGGGRGFGFTGGHFHKNWANDNFRKVVLNAVVWTAKGEIPAAGIQSSLSPADLETNLDPKPPRKKK
jgi:type 1 glutamine amidotransferase